MSRSSDTVSLRITLRYKNLEEFVDRYAENASSAGLFIRTKSPKPTGTKIRFELLLADGSRALFGEGVVVTLRKDDKPGMGIRFNLLDAESRGVIERIVQAHGQGALAPTPLSTTFPRSPAANAGEPRRPTSIPGWRPATGPTAWSSERTPMAAIVPRTPSRVFAEQKREAEPHPSSGEGFASGQPRKRSAASRPWAKHESTDRIRLRDPNLRLGREDEPKTERIETLRPVSGEEDPDPTDRLDVRPHHSPRTPPEPADTPPGVETVAESSPHEVSERAPLDRGESLTHELAEAVLDAAVQTAGTAGAPLGSLHETTDEADEPSVAAYEIDDREAVIGASQVKPPFAGGTWADQIGEGVQRIALDSPDEAPLEKELGQERRIPATSAEESRDAQALQHDPRPLEEERVEEERALEARLALDGHEIDKQPPEACETEQRAAVEPTIEEGFVDEVARAHAAFLQERTLEESDRSEAPPAEIQAPAENRSEERLEKERAFEPVRVLEEQELEGPHSTIRAEDERALEEERRLEELADAAMRAAEERALEEEQKLEELAREQARQVAARVLEEERWLDENEGAREEARSEKQEQEAQRLEPEPCIEAKLEELQREERQAHEAARSLELDWSREAFGDLSDRAEWISPAVDASADEGLQGRQEHDERHASESWSFGLLEEPGRQELVTELTGPKESEDRPWLVGLDEPSREDPVADRTTPKESEDRLWLVGLEEPRIEGLVAERPPPKESEDRPWLASRDEDPDASGVIDRFEALESHWFDDTPSDERRTLEPYELSGAEPLHDVGDEHALEAQSSAIAEIAESGEPWRLVMGMGVDRHPGSASADTPDLDSEEQPFGALDSGDEQLFDDQNAFAPPLESEPSDQKTLKEPGSSFGEVEDRATDPDRTPRNGDLGLETSEADVRPSELRVQPAFVDEAAEAIAAVIFGESEALTKASFHEALTDESRSLISHRTEAATELLEPVEPDSNRPSVALSVTGVEVSRRAEYSEQESREQDWPGLEGSFTKSEPRGEAADVQRRRLTSPQRVIMERDSSNPPAPTSFNEEATLVPAERRAEQEISSKGDELGTSDLDHDRIVGIDLGARWIRIGVMERNELELIPAGGAVYVPALAAVRRDGRLAFGAKAKSISAEDPSRAVSPRALLHALAPGSINNRRAGAQQIVSYEGGNALILIGDRAIALHDLLREFFAWLRIAIEDHLKVDTFRAMISVPHDLDPEARMMMRRASSDAGLRIARLESEPNAAIRAYNLFERPVEHALLVDLGASHLAISLLKRGRDGFAIVGHDWWDERSAKNLDEKIAELALEALRSQYIEDYSGSPEVHERLLDAAEKARLDLRRAPTIELKVSLPVPGGAANSAVERTIHLQRSRLYQLTEEFIRDVSVRAQKISREGGVDPRALGAILLAGSGGSYPPLAQALQNLTTIEPLLAIPPSHLFTHGLVRSGLALEREESAAKVGALEASIGLELPGGRFRAVINAGETLPTHLLRPLRTRDGQTEIDLRLFQGDAEFVRSCQSLGSLHLAGLPKTNSKVEMEMAVDSEGVLEITLRETTTGASERLTLATLQTPDAKKKALLEPVSTPPKEPDKPKRGFFARLFGKR